jgi:hypothetical protein
LKLLRLETGPPDAPKNPIFAIFKANLQKHISFLLFMARDEKCYLDFRLPQPAKFAVGFPSPGKWGPFEKYLPITWNAPSFDRIFLGILKNINLIKFWYNNDKLKFC